MISGFFIFCSFLVVLVMSSLYFFLRNDSQGETSVLSPLESGFCSTGNVCSFFSLQLLTLLVLFLILDLEVVLVAGLLLSSGVSSEISNFLFFFILGSLWAEWSWGNLSWAV